jgi:hypothetical protein
MSNDIVGVSVTIAAKPATVYGFLTESSQFAPMDGPGSAIESSRSGRNGDLLRRSVPRGRFSRVISFWSGGINGA